MATEALYRPEAPTNGMGNIPMPMEELDLDAEAEAYARRWWQEEDKQDYGRIGSADFTKRVAMIFLLEAARRCAAGSGSNEAALKLARLGVSELERVVGR